jgi:transposase
MSQDKRSAVQASSPEVSPPKGDTPQRASRPPREQPVVLPILNPHAAGIDVHSDMHMVCVPPDSVSSPAASDSAGLPANVRRCGANSCDLKAIAAWLTECGVTTVAMESTGVYWIPLFELLESRGFEVYLVEPGQLSRLRGSAQDGCSRRAVDPALAHLRSVAAILPAPRFDHGPA